MLVASPRLMWCHFCSVVAFYCSHQLIRPAKSWPELRDAQISLVACRFRSFFLVPPCFCCSSCLSTTPPDMPLPRHVPGGGVTNCTSCPRRSRTVYARLQTTMHVSRGIDTWRAMRLRTQPPLALAATLSGTTSRSVNITVHHCPSVPVIVSAVTYLPPRFH